MTAGVDHAPRPTTADADGPAAPADVEVLPELAVPQPPAARAHHRVLSMLLLSLTVALVLGLFAGPWVHAQQSAQVGHQQLTPVSEVGSADLAVYTALGASPGWAAPVVLTYHDIAPGSSSPYVVTPEDFEAQLQMLHVAGYQSLTLQEFQDYLSGDYLPSTRSVLITFDDGTSGLWTYADRILERYGFRATSFVITGSVGTHQPYYLSWPELRRMQATGRWEFGSHTNDLHHRVSDPVAGHPAGLLAPQVDASGELEDGAAYAARVAADLDASVAAMTEHGLPAPRAFAYPFSQAGDGTGTPPDETVAGRLIHERFDLAFVNSSGTASGVSTGPPADGLIHRFELLADDDHRTLFEQVVAIH